MVKFIEQEKGLTVGHATLGFRGGVPGSVRQQVHDGDTANVSAIGNFGVRFLGVDAPEISFMLPEKTGFTGLSDQKWATFLNDPFDTYLPPFKPPLTAELRSYLQTKLDPGTAMNHYNHASAAEDALEEEVKKDIQALDQSEESFQFFLVFTHEIMDQYGRLLCFINRNQPDPMKPKLRPISYNERLLQTGSVCPYFIWPNVNPYRKAKSILEAIIRPGTAKDTAEEDKTLRDAQEWVRENRRKKKGIFVKQNPLKLEPFEVRFLARRSPPNRWVIDLSKNDNILIRPQNYYNIPNMEDRLYIPEEYVPLFVEKGWQKP